MHQLIRFFFFFLSLASYGDIRVSAAECKLYNIAVVIDSTKLAIEQHITQITTKYLSDFLTQFKMLIHVSPKMSGRVYHSNNDYFTNRSLTKKEHFNPTKGWSHIRKALQQLRYRNSSDNFNMTCAKLHLFSEYKEFSNYVDEGIVGMIIAPFVSVKDKFNATEGQYGIFIYHNKVEMEKVVVKNVYEAKLEIVKLIKLIQSFLCVTKTSSTPVHTSPSTSMSSYVKPSTTGVHHISSSLLTSSYTLTQSTIDRSSYAISSITHGISTRMLLINTSITAHVTTSAQTHVASIYPTKSAPTPGPTVTPTPTQTPAEQLNADIGDFKKQNIEEISKNASKVKNFMKEGMQLLERIDKNRLTTDIPIDLMEFLQGALLKIGGIQTVGKSICYNDKEAHKGMMVSTHNNSKAFKGVSFQNGNNNSISLPESFVEKKQDISIKKAAIAIMEYPTLPVMAIFKKTDEGTDVTDTSFLAAMRLMPSADNKTISGSQILYSLIVKKDAKKDAKYRCVFWEKVPQPNGNWSNKDCQVLNISDRLVSCKCNHKDTLSFSVMTLKKKKPSRFSLDMTTYIGCAVAGGVCGILMLIFIIFRRILNYDQNVVHFNLAISIAVSNALYVAADFAFKIKHVCMGVSIGIMYFYLATLFWILVESIHLYMLVVRMSKDSNLTKFYLIIGWVAPSIVVAVTAALERKYFLKEQFCWLTYDSWVIWTLVGPSLLIIFISVVLLAIALSTSFKMERSLAGVDRFQLVAKLVLFLIPVIGICWSLSLLAVNEKKIIYQYALTGVNGLVGVVAFISYYSLSSGIKKAITPKRKPLHSIRSSSSVVMGKDNKGNDASMVSLSIITEPAFHSKTNF